jgi:uncharacterized membrane protein YoaK (UPF0700 family)
MQNELAEVRSEHVPSELFAIRDSLLVALSFSAGMFEAICFLSLGKVFCAFQSGNLVFLGLIASRTQPPQGPDPVTVLISLAAFAAGAALAMPILRSFDGDIELDDSKIHNIWPRHVTMALGLSLVMQITFLALWMVNSQPARAAFVLIGLNAFAMGLQMNAIRLLHVPGVSTTAATATFITLVSGIATRSRNAATTRRLSAVVAAIVGGALVGVVMLSHFRGEAPIPPVVVNATVLAIASVALSRPLPPAEPTREVPCQELLGVGEETVQRRRWGDPRLSGPRH